MFFLILLAVSITSRCFGAKWGKVVTIICGILFLIGLIALIAENV